MDQAAWNLCPVSGVSSGTACYYATDQTFSDLVGTVSVTIDDCPDGASHTPTVYMLYTVKRVTESFAVLLHILKNTMCFLGPVTFACSYSLYMGGLAAEYQHNELYNCNIVVQVSSTRRASKLCLLLPCYYH